MYNLIIYIHIYTSYAECGNRSYVCWFIHLIKYYSYYSYLRIIDHSDWSHKPTNLAIYPSAISNRLYVLCW